VASLVGTKWSGKYRVADFAGTWDYQIEFLTEGQFKSINRGFQKDKGKYTESGNTVTVISSDGHKIVFQRDGDTMTGISETGDSSKLKVRFSLKKQ
jgi:hypothetical protein